MQTEVMYAQQQASVAEQILELAANRRAGGGGGSSPLAMGRAGTASTSHASTLGQGHITGASGSGVTLRIPSVQGMPVVAEPAAVEAEGIDEDELPFDDNLPETPNMVEALRAGELAESEGNMFGLLMAMQTAIKDAKGGPASASATPAGVPLASPSDVSAAATPAVGAAADPRSASVQAQLQEQKKQLSLLSQLQQQLMTQQVQKAQSVRSASQFTANVSPMRQYRASVGVVPVAAPLPASYPSVAAYPLPARADDPALNPAARPPIGAYGAVSPPTPLAKPAPPSAASRPLPTPQPLAAAALYAPSPAALPAIPPVPSPAPAAADILAAHYAVAPYSPPQVAVEDVEAKESVHRLITDFIAQKNLTNALTERLAEKTNEAEGLRARIATGEGREHLQQMSETLTAYEKELASERARTLSLEHEVYKLRLTLDTSGLPVPRVKAEYEAEIQALQRKLVQQEQKQADLRRQAEAEKEGLLREAEGRVAKLALHANDALRNEVVVLKQKLQEKKTFNHELQQMLKLHLKYNAEARNKALLQQPEWVHPLLQGPTPPHQDVQDPRARLEL